MGNMVDGSFFLSCDLYKRYCLLSLNCNMASAEDLRQESNADDFQEASVLANTMLNERIPGYQKAYKIYKYQSCFVAYIFKHC